MEKYFGRILINKSSDVKDSMLTHENLRKMYGTGQAFSKGTGKDRTYTYRSGIRTEIGDIQEDVYLEVVARLVAKNGEQELFNNYMEWEKLTSAIKRSKKELQLEAADAYTRKMHENRAWWDYIAFNRKYYPERLEDPSFMSVILDCCGKEIKAPSEQIRKTLNGLPGIPCPFCNKLTTFKGKEQEN